MAFTKPIPEWNNPGVEPNQNLKNSGWLPQMSPAPDTFNWQWNSVYEALKELQTNAVDNRDSAGDTGLQDHIDDLKPHYADNNGVKVKYGWKLNAEADGLIFVY